MSKKPHIIHEYFQNHYSEAIQKSFADWFTHSNDIEEKEDLLETIWNELDIPADHSTEASFNTLQTRLFDKEKPKKRLFKPSFIRVAAILVILILSTSTFYFHKKTVELSNNAILVECFVPNGETRTIVLPDSSKVILNSGSVLIYPQQFNGNMRDIFLNGEALFTVVHNEKQPFVVKTTDIHVKVLGTVFSVSSYADNENSLTTLESGQVEVRLNSNPEESFILKPNEQFYFNRNSGAVGVKNINVSTALAWKEGHLIMQSMPIHDVIKTIERRYGVTVFLNSNQYEDERITAKFIHGESMEEFLAIIKQLIPRMNYKIENRKVYIY